jgi:hypothetical protein
MLLDPSSTFASVRANVGFLREIVGDGSASAHGTPIKDALEASGRLKGDVCTPDYDFLDPDLDGFYAALAEIVGVTGWIHGHQALTPQLNWAWTEAALIGRLYPALSDLADYQATRAHHRRQQRALVRNRRVADVYEHGTGQLPQPGLLRRRCEATLKVLLEHRNAFMLRHQSLLLRALQAPD